MVVDVFVGVSKRYLCINHVIARGSDHSPGLQHYSQIGFKAFVPALSHALQHGNLFLFATAVQAESTVKMLDVGSHTIGVGTDSTTTRQAGNCNAQSKYDSEFELGLDHMLLGFQMVSWK